VIPSLCNETYGFPIRWSRSLLNVLCKSESFGGSVGCVDSIRQQIDQMFVEPRVLVF